MLPRQSLRCALVDPGLAVVCSEPRCSLSPRSSLPQGGTCPGGHPLASPPPPTLFPNDALEVLRQLLVPYEVKPEAVELLLAIQPVEPLPGQRDQEGLTRPERLVGVVGQEPVVLEEPRDGELAAQEEDVPAADLAPDDQRAKATPDVRLRVVLGVAGGDAALPAPRRRKPLPFSGLVVILQQV